MESKKEQMTTEVVYQGNHTYEIKKTIEGFKGESAILIGLYPTIDGDNITRIDSTQLHLINHMKELGLCEVRIMNLYPDVFDRKPSTVQLSYDKENFEYIMQAINATEEYKIVIAYGSSHSSNKTTNMVKKNLLEAIGNSKAKDRVYQISSEYIDTMSSDPTHVLYLGLRHGDERWKLVPLDVSAEMAKISARLAEKNPETDIVKRKARRKEPSMVQGRGRAKHFLKIQI